MVKKIAGIPTHIINGHQEAYRLWNNLYLREKTLVHVDAHSDMWDNVKKNEEGDFKPNCGNYLLPSIKQKIINEVWWINPFSFSKYCLHLVEKLKIPECVSQDFGKEKRYFWKDDTFGKRITEGEGFENEDYPKINGENFILDIDLDAFSCCDSLPDVQFPYSNLGFKQQLISAERDYSPRISKVIETLSKLPRPEMIVIAKSRERIGGDNYISSKYARPVKKELVRGLEKIFS